MSNIVQPVIDLHCDLLSYLAHIPGASFNNEQDMGAALPLLQAGNVRMQVLAIYTDVVEGSTQSAKKQMDIFNDLLEQPQFIKADKTAILSPPEDKVAIIPAIENAAGLCEASQPLDMAFKNLDALTAAAGRIIYISLTHHGENRFGGGNYAQAGLKPDGEALLDYLDGKQIAIDLSHTSDALAWDIINFISKRKLAVPVIASHSNFRPVFDHVRNITKEMLDALIELKGLIGINFLRAYVNKDEPNALLDHIAYAFENGAEELVSFGADFFYTKNHPDPTRIPFYFPEHENASVYQNILAAMSGYGLSLAQVEALANGNVKRFIREQWK